MCFAMQVKTSCRAEIVAVLVQNPGLSFINKCLSLKGSDGGV
jgi:hypothetical protein